MAELLGVEYPIVAFSHCRDVVAAVTNAGGFGVLGAVAHSPGRLDVDLAWIDEQRRRPGRTGSTCCSQRCTPTPATTLDRDTVRQLLPAEQQHFVDEILTRYGVPALPEGADEARPRMSVAGDAVGALLDVAFAHPIRLVASALGAPPPPLVERAHDAGVLVAALAGRAEHADPPSRLPAST